MWPSAKPTDDIGTMIKSYIKDVNKLIDEGVKPAADDEDEDDDDDGDFEELPRVPDSDDNRRQEARDDAIEDDVVEESKNAAEKEEKKLFELPPEPFRLDELRISAPMLRNELSDSLKFFENMLREHYGSVKFAQALQVLEQFEKDGHDRYSEQSETYLVK